MPKCQKLVIQARELQQETLHTNIILNVKWMQHFKLTNNSAAGFPH